MVSFFTEKNFLGSMIRGKQIADYIGGQYNPKCIYIKPTSLDHIRDCDIVDVSDGEWVVDLLKKRPKIKVIAHSLYSFEYLKGQLENEIVLLPQQHLNWERAKRDRVGVTRCGYIGKHSKFADEMYKKIGDALKPIEFEFFSDYFTREDAINFFKRIDLLIVAKWKGDGVFKTPAKLINAASFGIPSIAGKVDGYKEFEGYYIPFDGIEKMLEEVKKFKNLNYYVPLAEKITKKAEEYHISRIAELYKQL